MIDGRITQLLGHAKENAATRKKIRNDNSGDFSLVRKDLYDIWNAQEGKCYYSGIPLSFRSSWKLPSSLTTQLLQQDLHNNIHLVH